MRNGMCVVVLAAAVFAAGAASAYQLQNGVLTVYVEAGDTQTNLTADQLEGLADADCTELRKTGGGTLALTDSTGLSDFKGTIRISDGVYQAAGGKGFLGKVDGPTIVESGATLKFVGYVNAAYYVGEEVQIAGTGYGSEGGAIVGNTTDNVNLRNLTLTADATTCAPGANHLSFYGALDMRGYTLTLHMKGTGRSHVLPTSVISPGHLVFKGNGSSGAVEVPQSCDFPGGSEYTMTFTDGAYPRFYESAHTNKVCWTLRPRTAGSYALRVAQNQTMPAVGCWHGPIELPDSGTFTLNAVGHELHLYGPISGGATIATGSSADGVIFLHGTNTYTGTLQATAARVVAMSEDALPGWNAGHLTGTKSNSNPGYGVYLVSTNATRAYGWRPERIGEAFRYLRTAGKWNVCLYAAEGETTICELPAFDPADVNYGDQYVFTCGNGRHVIRGDYPNAFQIYSSYAPSDVIYTSRNPATANFTFGLFKIYGTSTVTFENMGYMEVVGYPYVGNSSGQCATCVVGTNTVLGVSTGGKGLYVPNGKNSRGLAKILPGAIVSNGVWVSTTKQYTNACGMVVQKGGLVHSSFNASSLGQAVTGLGYYELCGGRFASTLSFNIGVNDGSCGFLRQTGGEFEMLPSAPYLEIGAAGTGLVHVAGGSFKSATDVYAPKSTDSTSRSGCGRFSVANGARPLCEKGVFLADRIDAEGSVDLLGGGVLETPSVTRCATLSYKSSVSTGNATAYVNFNGGGLCAISNDVELLGSGSTALTRATVYSAGAILEAAQDVSANVSVPLQAATGGGISALALPEGGVSGCRCSPVVQIFGDGIGAAAVAEYDSDADTVTGITVTSPGWGYTAANTTAVLHWCGNTGKLPNIALSVTVTDAASLPAGGLTKRGEGRIALAAANAYGGDTVIEKGTLAALVPGAIPSDSAVTVMPGGAIELASGVGYPADLTVDLDGADDSLRYPVILCPDGMPEGVPSVKGIPAGWTLRLRGTTWEAAHLRGSVFCIR